MVVARRVLISGRVQGVWFRESCSRQAAMTGVTGWVRNLDDGQVEAWIEGESGAVDALEAWCRIGPSHAVVTAVSVEERVAKGHITFEVVG